jgi:hypothetical protein
VLDNEKRSIARPWRTFILVLIFCLPSFVLVVGSAIFPNYITESGRPEGKAALQLLHKGLVSLAISMYFFGPLFFIAGLVTGLLCIVFGSQAAGEKRSIGFLLFGSLVATMYIYTRMH